MKSQAGLSTALVVEFAEIPEVDRSRCCHQESSRRCEPARINVFQPVLGYTVLLKYYTAIVAQSIYCSSARAPLGEG